MGMRSIFAKSARWAFAGLLAAACFGATQSFAATASDDGCSGSSQSKDGKTCAFGGGGSNGLQNMVSGSGTFGALFSNGFGGSGSGGGNTTSGGLSASRFALSTRETGKAAAGMGSNWNAWLSLSQSDVAYKFQPLQSSGHVNVAIVGVDYTFANNLTLGLVSAWDKSRIGTTFNGGNLNSDGNIVAPYLSWRFAPAWSVDASLGWGRSKITQVDNSVPGGIYGNYNDKRTIGSLSLAYTKLMGKWIFTGRGAYVTAEDKYDQFTLSTGTTIAASTNRTSQIRLGGQAMYNGGVFLPYAGVYYFNDVQRASQSAVGGSTPANDRDGFQLQLGIQFAPKSPIYGGVMISSDVGRSQVKNDMIMGNVGIRF
jgi:hypothetical protein